MSRDTALQNRTCAQRRHRSACTSAQSDQSLSCPPKDALGILCYPQCPANTLIRLREWSDLSLRLARLQSCRKCCVPASTIIILIGWQYQYIWATLSEKVFSNMRKMHRFKFIPGMRKVSSGHLLSIDTFYSVQLFSLRMRRLIWAFTVRICPKTRFCIARPVYLLIRVFSTRIAVIKVPPVAVNIKLLFRIVWKMYLIMFTGSMKLYQQLR